MNTLLNTFIIVAAVYLFFWVPESRVFFAWMALAAVICVPIAVVPPSSKKKKRRHSV